MSLFAFNHPATKSVRHNNFVTTTTTTTTEGKQTDPTKKMAESRPKERKGEGESEKARVTLAHSAGRVWKIMAQSWHNIWNVIRYFLHLLHASEGVCVFVCVSHCVLCCCVVVWCVSALNLIYNNLSRGRARNAQPARRVTRTCHGGPGQLVQVPMVSAGIEWK